MSGLLRALKPFIRRGIGILALFTRPKTLGVRVIVRDAEGRIFLVRHSYLPGWYLPGGGVDGGEPAGVAALRELREEGGLIGEAPRLFGVYLNTRISRRDYVILYLVDRFVATPWQPNAEIREIGFFALDALPEDTSGATRRRIRELVDGVEPDAIW